MRALPYAALAAILALGVALRLSYLWQPMHFDESLTYLSYAHGSLREVLTKYDLPNNHIFHTILVWLATRACGNSEWAIRLPAFLAGIVLIPAVFAAVRASPARHGALPAAALAATLSPFIDYSTNARGYTLVCLFTVICLLAAQRAVRHGGALSTSAFVLSGALGFYTLPTMAYGFGAVAAWVLITILNQRGIRDSRAGLRWLAATVVAVVGLAALLYAPALLGGPPASDVAMNLQPRTWSLWDPRTLVKFQSVWQEWHGGLPVWLAAALSVLALISIWRRGGPARREAPLLLAGTAFVAALFIVHGVIPHNRAFVVLLPLYCIAIGGGAATLVEAALRQRETAKCVLATAFAFALAALISARVVQFNTPWQNPETGVYPPAQAAVRWLNDRLLPGDRVLVDTPADFPVFYYALRHGLPEEHFYEAPTGRVFIIECRSYYSARFLGAKHGLGGTHDPPRRMKFFREGSVYLTRPR